MSDTTSRVGKIVQLRSGGPLMTVLATTAEVTAGGESLPKGVVEGDELCGWFDPQGGAMSRNWFRPATIKDIDDDRAAEIRARLGGV